MLYAGLEHIKRRIESLEKSRKMDNMYVSIGNVYKDDEGIFIIEGQSVEKMLGYTNLDDEKGFNFFQNFMKNNGILDQLKELGIQEGETVQVGGYLEFSYFE